jgi:cell division septum initiation protein DivIVA
MPRQEMDELLAQLRKEVAGARELSEGQRARMDALQAQLEEGLAAEETPPAGRLRDVLRGQIDEFQREHPTLTLVLGRILDSLNKMGI